MSALNEHFKKMQLQVIRYITPEDYIDIRGNSHKVNTIKEDDAFINGTIYMLDGPEQRAAQAEEGTE